MRTEDPSTAACWGERASGSQLERATLHQKQVLPKTAHSSLLDTHIHIQDHVLRHLNLQKHTCKQAPMQSGVMSV